MKKLIVISVLLAFVAGGNEIFKEYLEKQTNKAQDFAKERWDDTKDYSQERWEDTKDLGNDLKDSLTDKW